MWKGIQSFLAVTLCGLGLCVFAVAGAQAQRGEGPGLRVVWEAEGVQNLQLLSGDRNAAAACADLFTRSVHGYWSDGSWMILLSGASLVYCEPQKVQWDQSENALRLEGRIWHGVFDGTTVSAKVYLRSTELYEMEIRTVKEVPGGSTGGPFPPFDATFLLRLRRMF
jgi:hypothetical protein